MKQQLWLIISHLQYFGRRSLRSYTHVSMASSDTESLEALKFESLKEEDDGEVIKDEEFESLETGKKGGKKKKMAAIMRLTINELETALKESHEMLAERDKEIMKLKKDINHYKQQTAKEVAAKTKLAQSLDQTNQAKLELEDSLHKWQLTMKENRQRIEYLETALQQEHLRSAEQERNYGEMYSKKCLEVEQLTSQLIEIRQKSPMKGKPTTDHTIDQSQLIFLKQAVFHMLTDSHADEHLRAIVSILNFTAQERKAVYAKVQEKGGVRKNIAL